MTGSPPRPRVGVRLDPAKLDFELARRGVTARQLGARIGLSEVALSRARNGHCVRETTLRRIADGLRAIPELDGATDLLAPPRAPAG
jgi:transcriptional regulator with XRE-family HTH domain